MFQQVAYASYNDQFVSINGSRVNANQFYLDGGANSEPGFNGPGMFPPVDLVQEYKVQTNNFTAEFGNTAGGVINVVTKSGTNKPHGSLYDFVRNDKFNPRMSGKMVRAPAQPAFRLMASAVLPRRAPPQPCY